MNFFHSQTFSITQVGQVPFIISHPLISLQTSLSTRTFSGGLNTWTFLWWWCSWMIGVGLVFITYVTPNINIRIAHTYINNQYMKNSKILDRKLTIMISSFFCCVLPSSSVQYPWGYWELKFCGFLVHDFLLTIWRYDYVKLCM